MSLFICFDTNIFVRFISQGKPGCEPAHWDTLLKSIDSKQATLLVPECVVLEMQKQWVLLPQLVKAKLIDAKKELKKTLESQVKYSEILDFTEELLQAVDQFEKKKDSEMVLRHQQVIAFLNRPEHQHIPLDHNILLQARKRELSGNIADLDKKKVDADCMLIESLCDFFQRTNVENPQLLFCSENTSDFGLEVDGKWSLHPRVATGLPPATQLFLHLKDLATFISANQPISPPSPEGIQEAVEKEEERHAARYARTIRDLIADRSTEMIGRVLRDRLARIRAIEASQAENDTDILDVHVSEELIKIMGGRTASPLNKK